MDAFEVKGEKPTRNSYEKRDSMSVRSYEGQASYNERANYLLPWRAMNRISSSVPYALQAYSKCCNVMKLGAASME
jgi:hypothetical protein